MTYEEKMRMLQWVKPEKKDHLLARIIKGDKKVPITGDEDLFYRVNVDRIPLADQVNKRSHKYTQLASDMKEFRKNLTDTSHAQTNDKKLGRYLGEIPEEIYFTHPMFSPLLPTEERTANIKRFLNEFPAFRAGDKKL